MAKINLLPWREELRNQRQQEFLTILAGVAVAAAAIVWAFNGYIDGQLKSQNQRNAFIKKERSVLDAQITEIEQLKDKKAQLLERMELIQNLQGNRPIIVRLFDEFARTVPDDLYFTKVEINGTNAKVTGMAKSNNRVAALMRNLDGSDWFTSPNLISVKADGNGYNTFEVTMVQTEPKKKQEEE